MARLSRAAQKFIAAYGADYARFETAADKIEAEVERVVRDTGAFIHAVTARAKTVDSLRGKLRSKRYKKPHQQVTDLIGVRVIPYYRDDVDQIVAQLRQAFEINERHTTDKRSVLGPREFGYRSVHVIARLKDGQAPQLDDMTTRKRWFEIQVRSIIEHAWAEVEHEVVYKSGVAFPDATLRRFARLAGTLELLDNEFLALRDARSVLIQHYHELYEAKQELGVPFDAARLWGFLELSRPAGYTWRDASARGTPFKPALDVSCVEALAAAGLGRPLSLGTMIKSASFLRAVASFASDQGIAPAEVSHIAVVVLAIATKNLPMVQRHFPEFMNDPALAPILQPTGPSKRQSRKALSQVGQ